MLMLMLPALVQQAPVAEQPSQGLSEADTKEIQAWIGKRPFKPFELFALSRRKDRLVARHEPHRSWLCKLLKDSNKAIQVWAAARLYEAGIPGVNGGPEPKDIFLNAQEEWFATRVRYGNRDGADQYQLPGKLSHILGEMLGLEPESKVWADWRAFFRTASSAAMTRTHYALIAPELRWEDRDWVLRLFSREAGKKESHYPLDDYAYWLASDWLTCFGVPKDWETFEQQCISVEWRQALSRTKKRLQNIPCHWGQPVEKGDIKTILSEQPAETRNIPEKLEMRTFEWSQIKVQHQPKLTYPQEFAERAISGVVVLDEVIGLDGKLNWIRPLPGHAVGLFTAHLLEYASQWQFGPPEMNGVRQMGTFRLIINLKFKN